MDSIPQPLTLLLDKYVSSFYMFGRRGFRFSFFLPKFLLEIKKDRDGTCLRRTCLFCYSVLICKILTVRQDFYNLIKFIKK